MKLYSNKYYDNKKRIQICGITVYKKKILEGMLLENILAEY